MNMPALDIVVLAIILLSALIGLVRGLITEVLSLVGWVVAFIVANIFASQLAAMLPATWGSESVRWFIGFAILFVGILVLAGILRWLIAKLVETTGLSGTDRFLGFLFGTARGALVALVLLIAIREIAIDAPWLEESRLARELLEFEDEVRAVISDLFEWSDGSELQQLQQLQ